MLRFPPKSPFLGGVPKAAMGWSGQFFFGSDFAVYRGASAENARHAHAAIQLCFGFGAPVALTDRRDQTVVGNALYVRSCAPHSLALIEQVLIVLLEPHSARGRAVARLLPAAEIGLCPPAIAAMIDRDAPAAQCVRDDASHENSPAPELDPRLAKALGLLLSASSPGFSLPKVALEIGLSPSRLRHLAVSQLGLPLSKYVLWRKLRMASAALARGEGLAAAAFAGGFSDQAHFTKSMRALIGITPGDAQGSLR